MANRTVLNSPTTGTSFEPLTDERTVSNLSDGFAGKVQYIAEIDGTPDSPNVGIIDNTGAKKVFSATLATAAAQAAALVELAAIHAAVIDTTPVAVTGPLTDALLRAAAVPISNPADARRTVITTVARANDTAGYTSGDAVGALFTLAAFSRLANQSGVLCHLKITTNNKLYVPQFRVHFFNAANPASDVADNAPFPVLTADEAGGIWQGCVDTLPPMQTEDTTSTFAYTLTACELAVVTDANGALFGQIQAKSAIGASLANQVFTITATYREK